MQETATNARNISVLVIDDAKDLLQLVCDVLKFSGMKPKGITNGMDLFTSLEQDVFDIILMDIMIGGLDGRQLTKQLKVDLRYSSLPVLLYSVGPFNEGLYDDSGADGYLAKPFDMEELVSSIQQLAK